MATPILPGSTIGLFGSGQLGRMLAIAAKQMGYRIHTFSPETDSPTGQVADLVCAASYDDADAVESFIANTDVVTFEFENVDASVADIANRLEVPVHPGGWVLRIAQNRIREKSALAKAGLPVTPFWTIENEADLECASSSLGFPIVLKTASSGYDGKGQVVVTCPKELSDAWLDMNRQPAVAEKRIDFIKELSVVNARSADGEYAVYAVIENTHRNHILELSMAPAQISDTAAMQAQEIARRVMESFDVVGTLCVEYFLTDDDELLINEIAPRPHNSGHLTIEAAYTSQFEQHIRAICGLPLGDVSMQRPAAMVNLLGDLWHGGAPNWRNALRDPSIKLHLYGKQTSRRGRKMGHLTAVADEIETAVAKVTEARSAIQSLAGVDTEKQSDA